MRNTISLLYKTVVKEIYLLITISIIFSCSPNKTDNNPNTKKEYPQKQPVTITGKAPVITLLDTCPSPRTIAIPQKKSDSYGIKSEDGSKSIQLLPPEKISAGFFVPMQNFTTRNGLTSNAVMRGYIDKSGNLWFSTYGSGVMRYDGRSFTNYTKVHGLAYNWVWGIFEDKNGNIWFGTDGTGVSKYDGKSFKNFTTTDGLAGNVVWAINEDKKGDLWFATGGGVSRLSPGGKFTKYTTADGLPENNMSSLFPGNNGNVWFGTWGRGVSCYDGRSFINYTVADGLANNHVVCVYEDKNGNVWLGNEDGKISWLDSKKQQPGEKPRFVNFTIPGAGDVITIIEDKMGNLWFGTGKGAFRLSWDKKLNPDNESFTGMTTRQGLPNNHVNIILEDKSGNVWFGTEGVSVLERDLKFLTTLTSNGSLLDHEIRTILEDEKQNLWFGTIGGGLLQLTPDGKTLLKYSIPQGLPNDFITSIFQDKSGNLWIGNVDSGVSRISSDGKSLIRYTTAQGLPPTGIRKTIEDKHGNFWFGTWKSGVYRLSPASKSVAKYTTDQGLPENDITDIFEDKKGNIWIGTKKRGVSRFDPGDESFTNYTTGQGLAGNDISSIVQDKSGNLWIGTWGDGVSRYDGNSFANLTTAQGLPDDHIMDIEIDKEGIIWLGTNKGFTAIKGFVQDIKDDYNRSDLKNLQPSNELSNAELERSKFKPVLEIYNIKTGYPIEATTSNILVTHEGIIWAGTLSRERSVRFDYNSIHKNPNPPGVFIESIKINNEVISWYDLRHDEGKTDSFTTAPNVIEEVTQFGKILDKDQRQEMRKKFSAVKFDSITPFYGVPVNLVLPYEHNNITFEFSAIEPARPGFVRYQYMMEGYEKEWSPVTDKTNATYGNIHEGSYTFKLRAQSPDGVWSKPLSYTFKVLPPWWRTWWFIIIVVGCLVTLFYLVIRWRLQHQFRVKLERSEKEKQLAILQRKTVELEMQALRAQMSPHFIFNSLNSINMFILENNKLQASEYLSKFSRLVRLILQNSQEAFIPLDKELEALGLYLELESLRFEERFEYKISVNDEIDTTMVKVPPLIIQPYAENAIWHGLMHKKEKGHLEIELYLKEETLFCKITDDGIGRKRAAELKSKSSLTYKSMGMRITADRIAMLQQQEQTNTFISVNDLVLPDGRSAGTEVLIKVPINYD